ncbi:reverse transcriptase domain-containing protein [Tanacetum coccineum]
MPTWYHMFNSMLIGSARVWFNKLPPESIDNYEMLRKTFLRNYSQQKKYIKDPVEIHHIKQRKGEPMEAIMERFKAESMHVSRAPECMSISGFMHAILRGEVAAANQSKKKVPPAWKHHETSHIPNFDKRLNFKNQHKSSRRQDRFTPLMKTPKEILAMETIKFKAPSPMIGPAENRNKNNICEFLRDKGHSTDECIHLRKQIKEEVKSGQLSHLVKEIKQGGKRGEQTKTAKKGEAPNKEKGDGEHSTSALMNFMVVRSPSPYNGIIFRPCLRKIQTVLSIAHGMLKFPVEGGIVMICSNTVIPAECRMVAETQNVLPPKEPTATEGIKVAIHPEYPEQTVTIGGSLSEKGRMELCNLLKDNLDIFAWKPADMTGVPRSTAEHRLNIREGCQPIRQKRRGQAPNRNNAIQEEVAKLVEAEIMRRSIPGPRSQHARNQSLSGKSRSDDEATITPNIKRSSEPKRKAGDLKQILIQIREKVTPLLQNPQKVCKKSDFQWTPEAERAFQNMKKCIAELPMVTAPKPKEELIMYLYAVKKAVSVVLLTEKDSRACHKEADEVLPSIPGGVDFIAERPDEEGPSMEVQAEETIPELWTLFMDGSSCLEGSGARLILTSQEGEEFTYALRFEFDASNNEAEYEALVAGLRIAKQMGVKKLIAKVDSRLVANQINGLYEAKEQSMTQNTKKKVNRREGNPSSSGRGRRVLLDDTTGRISYERKSFLEAWLRCVGPTQAEYEVKEIHEGSCSMHSGPRSVVAKAIRSGYYWPIMHKDAWNIIRKCDDCQTHRPVPRNPQQKLTPITSPWLFYKWGIDISGPFSEVQGKVKFFIIAIDYFTKWIKAKPVATIMGSQVNKFVWDNIVCRFGLLEEIIFNNRKQFRDNPANRSLGEGIKARLGEDNRNWVEEVPHVLWAHRTMIKTSNGDISFSFTYCTKAVIPIEEIGMPSIRCAEVNQAENDEGLFLNLDILEERREKAAVPEARNKAKMEKYYNAKVHNTSFRPGGFVYRSNEESHAKESGKMGPKWEGPYEVVEALRKGAYKLRNESGDVLPRTWNVQDLKKCYL